MDPQFSIGVERNDGTSVVRLTGEIDLNAVPALHEHMDPLHGNVIVDLAGVTFLDSSGIGALVRTRIRIEAGGGTLVLRHAQPIVARTFEIVGLDDWLTDANCAKPHPEQDHDPDPDAIGTMPAT